MSYAVPKTWEHGEFPEAADINRYKSGLDDIYARTGTYKINPTVTFRKSGIQNFFIVHHHRWLLYRGDGRIEDPSGIGEDISLTGESSDWLNYDLLQVDWLIEGKVYQVQNVDACFEDYEPL